MQPLLPASALLICLILSFGVMAASLPGRVLHVVDGDTLILDVRGGHYRVDLADIDAPELNQPWGGSAADQLRQAVTGAFLVVEAADIGRNQVIGRITLRERDIALDLLASGLAWSTVPTDDLTSIAPGGGQDPLSTHPYTRAEARARAARIGLWSEPKPVAPWEWRRQRGGPLP